MANDQHPAPLKRTKKLQTFIKKSEKHLQGSGNYTTINGNIEKLIQLITQFSEKGKNSKWPLGDDRGTSLREINNKLNYIRDNCQFNFAFTMVPARLAMGALHTAME